MAWIRGKIRSDVCGKGFTEKGKRGMMQEGKALFEGSLPLKKKKTGLAEGIQ